jgi:hypothetical protein
MSLSPSLPNNVQQVKDFWDRKEGIFGKKVLWGSAIALGIVAVYFWGLILPFLLGVMANTVELAGLVAVLVVISSPIWSSRVRRLVSNAFQLAIRWSYGALIATDPIGMLRNNVENLRKQGVEFDKAVSQLAGSKQRLESDIAEHQAAIEKDKSLSDATTAKLRDFQARAASLTGNERQEATLQIQRLTLTLQGYKQEAGIHVQTIQAERPILAQTNKMYDQLSRLRDLAQFKVQSLSQQADMYAKQRATILASQKALGAATRILKGDPEQLAIVDQTIEYLNNEAADTLGAMSDFNRWSDKYLTDMDIQNAASADTASKVFEALEQKLSLPSPIDGMPIPGVQDESDLALPARTGASGGTDDYSSFLR